MPLASGLLVLLIAIMVPSPAAKWLRDLNGYQKTRKERTRRQLDDEFKEDAVRLVESGNSSIGRLAKDLGIQQPTLFNWVDKAHKERWEVGANPDIAAENRRLCKEVVLPFV